MSTEHERSRVVNQSQAVPARHSWYDTTSTTDSRGQEVTIETPCRERRQNPGTKTVTDAIRDEKLERTLEPFSLPGPCPARGCPCRTSLLHSASTARNEHPTVETQMKTMLVDLRSHADTGRRATQQEGGGSKALGVMGALSTAQIGQQDAHQPKETSLGKLKAAQNGTAV